MAFNKPAKNPIKEQLEEQKNYKNKKEENKRKEKERLFKELNMSNKFYFI